MRWRRVWTRVPDVGVWLVLAVPAVVCGTVWLGVSITPTMAAAQGLLPLALPLGIVVMIVAGARRRERQVVGAALVVLASATLVAPQVTATQRPEWATRSRRFTVVAANLWRHNPVPGAAFASLARADADVVVLSEWQDRFLPALDRSPLGRMTRVRTNSIRDDTLLLTQLPVTASGVVTVGDDRGGPQVRVVPIHTSSPYTMRFMGRWRDELAGVAHGLRRPGRGTHNLLLIGDFNATVWNPPFRDLLGHGLTDAQAATGRGLARTWAPRQLPVPPLLGIDHALSRGQLAPLESGEMEVPGSDHHGIRVVYAIR